MKTKLTIIELEKEIEILRSKLIVSEASDNFNSFFENNKCIMLQINAETKKIINANKRAVDFYGYPKNELLQKTIDSLNTLLPSEIDKLMKEAIKIKSNFFQFQHKLANGTIKDVEIFGSPLKFNNELSMVISVYDITEWIVYLCCDELIESINFIYLNYGKEL